MGEGYSLAGFIVAAGVLATIWRHHNQGQGSPIGRPCHKSHLRPQVTPEAPFASSPTYLFEGIG